MASPLCHCVAARKIVRRQDRSTKKSSIQTKSVANISGRKYVKIKFSPKTYLAYAGYYIPENDDFKQRYPIESIAYYTAIKMNKAKPKKKKKLHID